MQQDSSEVQERFDKNNSGGEEKEDCEEEGKGIDVGEEAED